MILACGDEAEIEAALRANRYLSWGNPKGERTWLRTKRAIAELQAPQHGDGRRSSRRWLAPAAHKAYTLRAALAVAMFESIAGLTLLGAGG